MSVQPPPPPPPPAPGGGPQEVQAKALEQDQDLKIGMDEVPKKSFFESFDDILNTCGVKKEDVVKVKGTFDPKKPGGKGGPIRANLFQFDKAKDKDQRDFFCFEHGWKISVKDNAGNQKTIPDDYLTELGEKKSLFSETVYTTVEFPKEGQYGMPQEQALEDAKYRALLAAKALTYSIKAMLDPSRPQHNEFRAKLEMFTAKKFISISYDYSKNWPKDLMEKTRSPRKLKEMKVEFGTSKDTTSVRLDLRKLFGKTTRVGQRIFDNLQQYVNPQAKANLISGVNRQLMQPVIFDKSVTNKDAKKNRCIYDVEQLAYSPDEVLENTNIGEELKKNNVSANELANTLKINQEVDKKDLTAIFDEFGEAYDKLKNLLKHIDLKGKKTLIGKKPKSRLDAAEMKKKDLESKLSTAYEGVGEVLGMETKDVKKTPLLQLQEKIGQLGEEEQKKAIAVLKKLPATKEQPKDADLSKGKKLDPKELYKKTMDLNVRLGVMNINEAKKQLNETLDEIAEEKKEAQEVYDDIKDIYVRMNLLQERMLGRSRMMTKFLGEEHKDPLENKEELVKFIRDMEKGLEKNHVLFDRVERVFKKNDAIQKFKEYLGVAKPKI